MFLGGAQVVVADTQLEACLLCVDDEEAVRVTNPGEVVLRNDEVLSHEFDGASKAVDEALVPSQMPLRRAE